MRTKYLLHIILLVWLQSVICTTTSAQLNPLTIGAIPANDSIVVYHDVNINTTSLPVLFNHVASRGTIAGTGFSGILTDDPSTVAVDSTLTVVNMPPVLSGSNPLSVGTCQNTGISFGGGLAVQDANANQTITWTVTTPPTHGSITNLPFNTSSGTSYALIFPAGVNYTPTSGYTGSDQAVITISDGFDAITVTVNFTVNAPIAGNTIGTDQTVCTGTAPSQLAGALPTGGNGTFSYSWEMSTTGNAGTYSLAPGANTGQNYQPGNISVPTWFRRTVFSASCSAVSSPVAISTTLTNTWTGATDFHWETASNWSCGAVPTATTDVVIPSVTTQPFVVSGTNSVRNLTINSGANVQFSGTASRLDVYGTILANGTFDAQPGTVAFRSTAAQNIPAGPYTNIVIDGTGLKTPDGNVMVEQLLTLTSGNIQLGASNLTIPGTGSAISGGAVSSHIITDAAGRLIQQGIGAGGRTGAINFPVGTSATSYTPAQVNNTTGTIDDFSAGVIDNVYTSYTGDVPGATQITSNAVGKTWLISEAIPGGSSATVTLQWNAVDELGSFSRTSSLVGHYTGGQWTSHGSALATASGANPYTRTSASITSFSPFSVLGYQPCIDPTVPTIVATANNFCTGGSTTLSFQAGTATLNGAADWQWYTGSCGGTSAGNGTSITVSPSSTTQYFVRGEGGCVVPGACANTTINVSPNNTATLTSGVGTDAQSACLNTPITPITYATTGATGANVTGLPTGVTGSWSGNVVTISGTPTAATVGAATYTVTLTGGCGTITTTGTITVSPANTVGFTVSAPATITAGNSFSVTVTAKDQCNNTATSYNGTVHFTTTDPGSGVTLPGNYTFSAGDAGVHTFTGAILTTAGSQSVTATDVSTSITGATNITVTPAAATHLTVGIPASTAAGSSFSVTVAAKDQYNNTATGYTGAVHFITTDPAAGAAVPGNYTFTASDAGVHTFSGVTLVTAGSQNVTATDLSSSITGTGNTTVTATAATHFAVSAAATTTAGNSFSVTVTAKDQYNNTSTGYTSTIHFTTTDAGGSVTLPVNYTFIAGDQGAHTFSNGATLVTAGTHTITATDVSTSSITGTSSNITVTPAAATHFTVGAPASTTAGSSFSVTVTARDQYNNTATGYTGTVHFTTTDAGGSVTVPGNYTFTASDAGVHTFSGGVRLVTAGSQSVTATDVSTSITGTTNITVNAAAATHFALAAPASTTSGTPFTIAVTAKDQYDNTVTGYTGTVHFSTTDAAAGVAVPNNYTFTAGDQGAHAFVNGATLVTGCTTESITVTDVTTSSITGSATVTVNSNSAVTLTSAPGTNAQTTCINTAITPITYATTGATGANVTGLPTGVTGSWSANVVTISGTPTTTTGSPFTYTVTLIGSCSNATTIGTITLIPANTASLTSAAGTNNETATVSVPITPITYATTGATGITVTGLPPGVSAIWSANLITISGTPTVIGPFNYTVNLVGGCGSVSVTGTITVNNDNTINLTSGPGTDAQTKCINTAITPITYATTGATGATFGGLPAGVTGNWAANVVTISGTPTMSGPFAYTVTLTGGSNTGTTNGAITVDAGPVAIITPSTADAFCNSVTLAGASTGGSPTYAWTYNGNPFASTQSIILNLANGDGNYALVVTEAGCTGPLTTYNYQKQNLISSYNIFALRKVDLYTYNRITNGSIGVNNASTGQLFMQAYDTLNSIGAFVKAGLQSIGSPSSVPDRISSAAVVAMPTMYFNTGTGLTGLTNSSIISSGTMPAGTRNGNYYDLTIGTGLNVVITGDTFHTVTIGKNSKVTFTSPVVNAYSISASAGVKMIFSQPSTQMRISRSVRFSTEDTVNPTGNVATFYVGDHNSADEFRVDVGGRITANVYTPELGTISINGSLADPTVMTGTYIGYTVSSIGKSVIWNSYNCQSPQIYARQAPDPESMATATTENSFYVRVSPNPSSGVFTFTITSASREQAAIRILDITGKLVLYKIIEEPGVPIEIGQEMAAGNYLAEIVQGQNRKVLKITKME